MTTEEISNSMVFDTMSSKVEEMVFSSDHEATGWTKGMINTYKGNTD